MLDLKERSKLKFIKHSLYFVKKTPKAAKTPFDAFRCFLLNAEHRLSF
ncbi:hypothetical protein HMPREF0542_10886 [Ligilactobacillus ruminis ATCC 25644]|uniref:Uncharacterized protein n=1 Tax=Ligilactobacillus ruminis ATCC 25644 TaxID=525362 RepID=E7FPQ9_9LACO|nr:hypothetical protein HMPREF0542_10886 [Ligilactobacillus ruminis ATCC 25644]EGX99060.1 hypothetical protein ANHS_334 [Ligilactobacillus ruminis ATCC 25644]